MIWFFLQPRIMLIHKHKSLLMIYYIVAYNIMLMIQLGVHHPLQNILDNK